MHPAPLACPWHLRVLAALSLLAMAPFAAAQGLPQRINDTGATYCYAGETTVTTVLCSSSSWPGQDGAHGRDAAATAGTLVKIGAGDAGFDFTKVSNAGNELPADAALGTTPGAWGCTRDNVTGLTWRASATADRSFGGAHALVAAANAAGWCGHADWRLPGGDELLGLASFRRSGPAIDTTYFPATASAFHWTAEPDAGAPAQRARVVHFSGGFLNATAMTGAASVRLVRGGAGFGWVDNADGTVTDQRSGLTWDRCTLAADPANDDCGAAPATYKWQAALVAVQAANAANRHGHADWRLPNVKELASLVETARQRPAIDSERFPATPAAAFWSSTTNVHVLRTAWSVFFGGGNVFSRDKATRAYVRLVRNGDAAAAGTARDALFADGFEAYAGTVQPPLNALPMITLQTDGPITREVYVDGSMTITSSVPGENYSGSLEIRGRGNSTWDMPKKPYRIKLGSGHGLLGMPSSKHWVLLANYADKSLLRNLTALDLGNRIGMAWNPRSRMVEVTLNGQYRGIYQLAEQIRIDADRIDIVEMDQGDVSLPEVSGGYVLEIDSRRDCAGNVQFDTAGGTPFCIDSPADDEIVAPQYAWIRDYVQQLEDALLSPGFTDPATGYAAYLNPDSFIRWFLVNELFANVDAASFSSIWNYKDRGGRLERGPLWDFDLGAGNANYCACAEPAGFHIRNGTWYARLFQDAAFAAQVRVQWEQVKAAQLDDLPAWLDAQAALLARAAEANFQTWPLLDASTWPNVVVTGSYEGEVAYLKDWLQQRIDWLDANL